MRARRGLFTFVCAALALFGAVACRSEEPDERVAAAAIPVPPALAAAIASPAVDDADLPGDVERGRALVARFECNRCHEGTGLAPPPAEKRCVGCHQDILAGRFAAPVATMTRWQDHLLELRVAPSLTALGSRYRRGWIAAFLQRPYHLRPRLPASMPRLAIDAAEARDVAAYLTRDRVPPPPVSLDGASAARGRAVFDAKGCGSCHGFSGVGPLETTPGGGANDATGARELRPAVALAPDLRFTRDRFRAPELVAWLLDPRAVKADTPMPLVPLSRDEARDLGAFLLTAPVEPLVPPAIPARLPVLGRRVAYEEVYQRVFRSTCRHCHSDADYALGEGGPGNTGGFGFPPRRLNLGNYAGTAAGYLDDHGVRRSVFAPTPDGTPRLVAVLLARQAEEAGRVDPEVRGMPLGLPALSAEDVQVLESWVAQGRPQ